MLPALAALRKQQLLQAKLPKLFSNTCYVLPLLQVPHGAVPVWHALQALSVLLCALLGRAEATRSKLAST
jgi:hypothetical protein